MEKENEVTVESTDIRKSLAKIYTERFQVGEEGDAAECYVSIVICLQCFDAVGWAAGRASGLQKLSGGVLA